MAQKAYSLSHTKWMCKYHIVFTPKYRRKVIYNKLRKDIGVILKRLCSYKGIEIIEGHLMPDHVHMLVAIPPKYSVVQILGIKRQKFAKPIHSERSAPLNADRYLRLRPKSKPPAMRVVVLLAIQN